LTERAEGEILFEAATPIGFRVRVTRSYWSIIVTVKHPVMKGCETRIREALQNPDEIRRSRSSPDVFLFYRLEKPGRWTCAAAKRQDSEGFLITAYPTDAIKEGERIWPK
jgi:hypothetical protein